MPTYEYECRKCGRVFERFQSITEEPLKKCTFDGCDGEVRRLLSAGAGFILKGSGFYATDYRSESYKQKARAESGGSDKSESTSGSSSSNSPSDKSTATPSSDSGSS